MLHIHDEIRDALADGRPVVALETTIITHGLPYPRNVDAALCFARAVRAGGAAPAFIGVIDGVPHVGLSDDDLERLAKTGGEKIQLRTLALARVRRSTGGTTVSATMKLAHAAGVAVFATGGIGGVHRGAERTFDVSEDLAALAQIPVAVVSSGAKAILDLPRTLEVLETLGVPTVGYQTDEFPAFYHGRSGLPIPLAPDAVTIAALLRAQWRDLGLSRGVLVCNPPPPEHALSPSLVDRLIADAIARAEAEGVSGAALTPFLLAALDAASGGRTVDANVALAESNARVGAAIAASFSVG